MAFGSACGRGRHGCAGEGAAYHDHHSGAAAAAALEFCKHTVQIKRNFLGRASGNREATAQLQRRVSLNSQKTLAAEVILPLTPALDVVPRANLRCRKIGIVQGPALVVALAELRGAVLIIHGAGGL